MSTERFRTNLPRALTLALTFALSLPIVLVARDSPAGDTDPSRFGRYDVRTLFVIAKNTDRNEVQYGVRLDHECQPYSERPVYAYWRQFEQGPDVTEDLNFLDRTVYGIKRQSVAKRALDGSKVLMEVTATSDRGIAILTKKSDGKCVADTIALVQGAPARLQKVFVQLGGFLSVDYIELSGVSVATGAPVVERVKP